MLYIITFRSPHLRPEELQDIVILCNELPTEKEFELISKFPCVFIMEVKKNININSSRELNSIQYTKLFYIIIITITITIMYVCVYI